MAPRKAVKPAKALARSTPARRKPEPSLLRSPLLKTAALVIGVAGLAALGVALMGPRRFQETIVRPIRVNAIDPITAAASGQADRVWAETRPWRDHVGRVLSAINTQDVRNAVAQRLSGWVERFR